LNQPVFEREVGVSVGFPGVDELPTNVARGAPDLRHRFYLRVIPRLWLVVGASLVLTALAAFIYLARHSDIIRDATEARRPDGKRPYSLARSQMAFWFFLVVASYFFLWVVTGDKDTLTASVLGLIGISAGTALGAAIVDAGNKPDPNETPRLPNVDLSQPRRKIAATLNQLALDAEGELANAERARASIAPTDTAQLAANDEQQRVLRGKIEDLRRRADYFEWPPWKGLMYDLLGERNLISFHRFQIFVWTVVLGVIFCTSVYKELAMPEFSATLLGLMGISAGTYIGFKLPQARG
jgi:hypothetical protein